MEGEWRQYKDAFVGVAGELCGRKYTEKQTPMMVDGRGGEGSGGEAERTMIACIKTGGSNHTPA